MINFETPPEPGTTLAQGGQTITVTRIAPYERRDGSASFLVGWRGADGRIGVSGLRANSVQWGQSLDDAMRRSAEGRARQAASTE